VAEQIIKQPTFRSNLKTPV